MTCLCINPHCGNDCVNCNEAVQFTSAIAAVLAERQRQITAEGYSPEIDDAHDRSELARAAASYLCRTDALMLNGSRVWPPGWEFKPADYRRVLVKACALALAELERFDRSASAISPSPGYTVHSFVDPAQARETASRS